MSAPARSIISPTQLLATLRRYYLLWIIPTVVITLLALVYSLMRPISWRASQALIVRDEANANGPARIGRFDTSDAMKAAQETLVQMSRNPSVVSAAMREVGPSANATNAAEWPSRDDIEKLQGEIGVAPPKGGEFGRNEVIYLSVEGPTRQRAIDLTNAVCNQLELRMQELRRDKAQSLILELDKSTLIAQEELDAATRRLEKVERGVGRDLDELRTLSETGAGGSNLRASINQLRDEIRRVQLTLDSNSEQLKLLSAAREDANRLLAAPQRLFETQPALRRLKEGLVDAQLKTATLEGRMNAEHPDVKAARAGETEIRRQLNDEVELVRSNLDADLKVSAAQLLSLNKQLTETETRLNNVAVQRAVYVNLLAEVKQRGENLAKANKDLSDARASQAAAQSASLITRLDQPDPGNWPVGPSKSMTVLAGMAGGLMVGLGMVFLVAPLGNLWGRRWSDYVGAGRRAADRTMMVPVDTTVGFGRRSVDPVPVAAGVGASSVSATSETAIKATAPTRRRATDGPASEQRETVKRETVKHETGKHENGKREVAQREVSKPGSEQKFFQTTTAVATPRPTTSTKKTDEPVATNGNGDHEQPTHQRGDFTSKTVTTETSLAEAGSSAAITTPTSVDAETAATSTPSNQPVEQQTIRIATKSAKPVEQPAATKPAKSAEAPAARPAPPTTPRKPK